MKILMVCLGNICRSPMAEGILRYKAGKAGLSWTVESAGTNGFHDGEAPHYLSQKIARQHGIDICNQRSRRFQPEDFDRFDKIYALAEDVLFDIRQIAKKKFDRSKVDLLMNELYPGKNMDVPDPWSGPEEEYHEAFRLIDAACDAIIKKYSISNFQYSSSSDPSSLPTNDY
jgi:protein-tyrosine phosphatase